MPGFIDCHSHYVQSGIIGSFGDTLLSWLNQYTFPAEARFRDKAFADEVAGIFFRQMLSHGTTTANVFATTFRESVDAFFEESQRYNTRMICGKVLQDRNLPDYLKDESPEESIAISGSLLEKWHRNGRQLYAVIPRFAPTSTPRQLSLAGDLYNNHIEDGVYLHTHLCETDDEVAWVRELFPEARNYADVYRHFGLTGPHSIMAHCCVMTENEWQIMHDDGCSAIHCPSSNLFLGDGLFRFFDAKKRTRPVRVGIGTDIGAGTGFSIIRQLGEAYKTGMIYKHILGALESFYLATRGGAEALHLEKYIGSIAPGYEADLTIVDLHPTEFVRWRMQSAGSLPEKLFALQTLAPDNIIRATYVCGQKVFDRDRENQFAYPD